ncbi:fimbria/pilus outer membrane usher protein [Burkholderia multivorans]|uniref:fimbria/pilus outer membrane usher protein n=1 Tax=Burkholderia multivorans TaxID=87883 RepID=UPI001C20F6D5|nr:fimbria/pilus outer membrane usher protein [Burkholderia multivorans]MBU9163748.1 fimbrial biogenesis outer membrane usher protein [Burkholderia multivorans]
MDGMPRLKPVCAMLLAVIAGWHGYGHADEHVPNGAQVAQANFAQVEFDSSFLNDGAIDVSRYNRGNVVRAGEYRPDIYVGERWIGRMDVPFKAAPNTADAQPCFDKNLLDRIGVDFGRLPDAVHAMLAHVGACVRIGQAIPEASAAFDFNELRLDLSIPQASMLRRARGYVNSSQWSEGVPVGMLGYSLNVYQSHASAGMNTTQGYLGLDTGFNVQGWHVRHQGSYNWDNRGQRRYQDVATYVQRNLPAWSSQLVVGDAWTSGDLFDSTSFRGVRIQTDDRMLPESLRGYAPVVRGVANTNARVTVTQNGVKLYETTVAPGAFVIDDLYPTGYGGDLKVAVTEADGQVHSFSVPYASVPLSLRPGRSRFSVTAGVVRGLAGSTNPPFTQATWQRGFTNTLTGYAGVTVAQGYAAAMIGGVLNSSWGAFGADITHANTSIPGEKRHSGSSFRLSYAKNVASTGTNVALAAYRYSTNGYFGLNDAMNARDQAQSGIGTADVWRQRNRASVTMSQTLGARGGSLNLTAAAATYWNRGGSDVNYTAGYSNWFRNVSYGISATRQRDAFGAASTLLHLSMSIPLGHGSPATLSANYSRDTRGSAQAQTSLSGSLGADNDISYGLSVNHGSGAGSAETNGSANMTYRTRFADLSGSVGASADYQQLSFSARGAFVAHPGGLTLSQPLSETFAIVKVPHAEGARVTNVSGVRVDGRGYAVVPYLMPFSLNDIGIDPKGLSTDVELEETSQRVAPLAGAVPMLVFKTAYGRSAVIRMRRMDGTPVPFGATVADRDGNDIGAVGQGGKVFARGLADHGELTVRWGTAEDAAQCRLSYSLPVRKRMAGYQSLQSLDLPCVAVGDKGFSPTLSSRSGSPRP